MQENLKYQFLMSQLKPIEDLKDNEKTKISVVYHDGIKSSCILRVCKGRDLTSVCSALRNIRNPNTVVVYDFVYANGNTYVLEENIPGKTVSEATEDGTLPEQQTAKIIVAVCKALEELHRQDPPVIHNDINPSNIMLCEDGNVKLFDFDISRTYKKGQNQNTALFGTEEYASPEHFGYGQSEPRTDIYSLGVTMHKMVAGCGLSAEHKMTYSGSLEKIIKKCLEFDPKHRYASVSFLRKDLEKFLAKRKRIIRTAAGFVVLAIAAFAAVFMYQNTKSVPDTETITEENQTETLYERIASNLPFKTNEEEKSTDNPTTDSDRPFRSNPEPYVKEIEEETKPSRNEQEYTPDVSGTPYSTEEKPEKPVNTSTKNDSRQTAKAIALDNEYEGETGGKLEEEFDARWYKFTTTGNLSAYRFRLAAENTTYRADLSVYDTDGIKLMEFTQYPSHGKEGFLDTYLDSNTEYFVKITSGSPAKYKMYVSERICDAGATKETATEIKPGEKNSAIVNSTLSDWYVFTPAETCEYIMTLHNIDVGADIKCYSDTSFWGVAENENNVTHQFSGKENESIFLEIKSPKTEANGKYILLIEKKP